MKSFGNYIGKLRIEQNITLREFCKKTGFDPASWNKIENGYNKPPQSKHILKIIAEALNVPLESELYNDIVRLSNLKFVPREAMGEPEILNTLPSFIHTSSGETPLDNELNEIADIIKKSASPDISF